MKESTSINLSPIIQDPDWLYLQSLTTYTTKETLKQPPKEASTNKMELLEDP